ncbi:MAG: septum formation inhibitor Maf [Gammaproteobacteria bacterium]|nr:septum formation inhibitor Maf [Gammaproteobacteria bacterium]
MTDTTPIVLASTSPFRKGLLEKLCFPFTTDSPDTPEDPLPEEPPEALVCRLAELKARAVANQHPDSLIIGSDQVACIDGEILGKPGTKERAITQLENASGRRVAFYTGLCLLNAKTDHAQVVCEHFFVHFRKLDREKIERYLDKEEPYNCAGSFKSEALGITLFERLEGDDPNTLIGLPLIRLVRMLEREGVTLP